MQTRALLFTAFLIFIGCKSRSERHSEVAAASERTFVFMGDDSADSDWRTCKRAVDTVATELNFSASGLSTKMVSFPDNALENQINRLEIYATGNLGGLAIVPNYADNPRIVELLTEVNTRGTPVVTVRKDMDISKHPKARTYYVGNNEAEEGRIMGLVASKIFAKKKYTTAEYSSFLSANESSRVKREGFLAGIAEADPHKNLFTERQKYVDYNSLEAVNNSATAVLIRQDPIKMFVGYSVNHLAMISGAIEQFKNSSQYFLIGFGADQRTLDALKANKIDAVIVNSQYFTCLDAAKVLYYTYMNDSLMLKTYFTGDATAILRGPIVVVANDFKLVTAEDLPDDVRFMKVSDYEKFAEQFR